MKIKAALQSKRLNFQFEIKAVSETGAFEGYGSVFGVKDSYREIVEPGAFKESLAKHKAKGTMPALLWQHNPGEPIGVWTEMAEDETGLLCKGQLVLETQRGAEAHALLKAKALSGLSIGFVPVTETYDKDANVVRLNAVDLWECSVVTFPANQAAQITVVKSSTLPNTIREFEAMLRDVAGFGAKDAKALASGGWKALGRRDGEGPETDTDAKTQAAAVQALADSLKASRNGPRT